MFSVIQCKSISQDHPSNNTQSTHVYIYLSIQIYSDKQVQQKKSEWLKKNATRCGFSSALAILKWFQFKFFYFFLF